ncbi:TPA: hypothetical protein I8287_005443 [Kluyvera intermedia]|jgi:hypothetical protein|nr:hypothetical protein [Bifidobacterium longum]HAU8267691.1 hypothetical protein [Kluyvera intermedia]
MLKKAKLSKAIISIIALFSFIYWGLDSNFICKLASETPRACGYSERGLMVNVFGSGLAILLSTMAAAILAMWVSKD